MSIFSILQNSSRQQFNLRSGTAAQDNSKHLAQAENLTKAISSSGQNTAEAEEAAKSLFESYKEAADLSSSLSRSVKDNQDALRKQRVERIQQRIKQLKEMLRFATPEQAKRMLKELKQISKEFKTASQDLNKAGQGQGPGALSSTTTSSASAVSSVIEAATGTGAIAETRSAMAVDITTLQTEVINTSASRNSVPQSPTGNNPEDEDRQTPSGTSLSNRSSDQEEKTDADPAFDVKTAVQAYTDRLNESDSAHRQNRAARMQKEHEELGKIAAEIKLLADWLESLAEKDDDEAEKDLKDVRDDLKDGLDELNAPGLKSALGPVAGGATTSVSTVSSVSINLSTSQIVV
ncbi:hypothetical protein [Roseibium sp. SCP14]|uniref:hypothetical protein n=1 Tax=Roseibium sp. SCP14 TaxID=3141375 RepID=UPI003334B948